MEQDLYAAGYAAGLAAGRAEVQTNAIAQIDAAAQRRYELRDAYDNGFYRATHAVSDILCEVSDFLDNYTDAEYIDGRPVGNRAMNLKASIDELIG